MVSRRSTCGQQSVVHTSLAGRSNENLRFIVAIAAVDNAGGQWRRRSSKGGLRRRSKLEVESLGQNRIGFSCAIYMQIQIQIAFALMTIKQHKTGTIDEWQCTESEPSGRSEDGRQKVSRRRRRGEMESTATRRGQHVCVRVLVRSRTACDYTVERLIHGTRRVDLEERCRTCAGEPCCATPDWGLPTGMAGGSPPCINKRTTVDWQH